MRSGNRLNKEQSKFLKRINDHNIYFRDMSKKEEEICMFLDSLKYVQINTAHGVNSGEDFVQHYEENESVEITELGRMYLANEHIDKFKITIPDIVGWVLSCIALVISVISLLKQQPPQ